MTTDSDRADRTVALQRERTTLRVEWATASPERVVDIDERLAAIAREVEQLRR